MVSMKEIARREEELVSFLRMGLDGHAMANPKRTSGMYAGTLYLDIVSNLNGSKGIVVPLVAHVAEGGVKVKNLTKAALHDKLVAPAFILYKDNKDFFRFSATEDRKGFRQKYGRSLRNVSVDERCHYMLLADEERALLDGRTKAGNIDYYKPKTDVKGEGLVSYHFEGPVQYIRDPNSRFKQYTDPIRDSTLRFKWDSYHEILPPFVLEKGKIISIEDPNVSEI